MADVAHLRIQNLIPTAARRLISIYFRYHTLLKKKVFWNPFFFFFILRFKSWISGKTIKSRISTRGAQHPALTPHKAAPGIPP